MRLLFWGIGHNSGALRKIPANCGASSQNSVVFQQPSSSRAQADLVASPLMSKSTGISYSVGSTLLDRRPILKAMLSPKVVALIGATAYDRFARNHESGDYIVNIDTKLIREP